MIRVLCVEDDPGMVAYLEARLETQPDIRLVAMAASASDAMSHLAREDVDVILLDYQLPDANGMQLFRTLGLWDSSCWMPTGRPRVLFCTGFIDEDLTAEARARGAAGLVPKLSAHQELLPALRTVAAGGQWFATAH